MALEFGKLAGQESLFDLDSYENIKTGSDGKNPITFTPEQLASIAEDLSNGELPDIEGMLKGTPAGSAVKEKKYLSRGGNSPEVKTHNIDTAKSLLSDLGVDASFRDIQIQMVFRYILQTAMVKK